MITHPLPDSLLARALDARDVRFDGVFFVGIVTTHIYCRPVCPARVSDHSHRRFFPSAATAERAGFRPCLRCRPELAPGRSPVDALSRLAGLAERRIATGALNGRSVAALAGDLGVSERHLRRAFERELGVSPVELAQTHRLLLAKRLLADTALPVTQIAYASGFQSLRRFNATFREQYRMAPSAVRRAGVARRGGRVLAPASGAFLPVTLAYRPPLAVEALLGFLGRDVVPGVDLVQDGRYGRTIALDGRSGVVFAAPEPAMSRLRVELSPSLVPVLMPLLVRLRELFDLDAEPAVIDRHLSEGGLAAAVSRRPGLRIPGAVDGFDLALRALLRAGTGLMGRSGRPGGDAAERVARSIGEPIETGNPALCRLAPSAHGIAEAGSGRLEALGVPRRAAIAAVAMARLIADGVLRLEPGASPTTVAVALQDAGICPRAVSTILMRALGWPDAFPASSRALERAAGVSGSAALSRLAERWRPWRAYAALHLWLVEAER